MHSYDFSPTVAALNIVLAKYATKNGGINVGKNRYFFPTGTQSQGSYLGASKLLVAYRGLSQFVSYVQSCTLMHELGFYSSVRPVYKQLSVNLNVSWFCSD